MSSFQVVYDDLASAATAFGSGADQVQALGPDFEGVAPDTGDAGLTATAGRLLQAFDLLHGSLTTALRDTATKLGETEASYRQTDSDVHHLFDRMMGG